MRTIFGIPDSTAHFLDSVSSPWIRRKNSYGIEADFHKGVTGEEFSILSLHSLYISFPGAMVENLGRLNFGALLKSLLSMERFWEAHEIMEIPWRKSSDPLLYHGFIRILVSQVKWQMDQKTLVSGVLNQGINEITASTGLKREDILQKEDYPAIFKSNFLDRLLSGAETNI